ncbi:MAG: ribosome small subunit-dependent GTPase A [Clostridium sp.]|nr:ribosome small subunit-dependent GTPase A [Clostridium sp.]
MQGKIIKGIAGFYYVHDGIGSVYECRARGVFRNRNIKPLVGDDVEFSVLDEKEQTGNIDRLLPSRSRLIRPAVANVDQALVVFAMTDPQPNLNLLDRFLIVMERQHVPVIICFSKADLGNADGEEELRRIYEPGGYRVCFISTNEGQGLPELMELLDGKTTVLAGPSGVGKSSLTNYLQPEAGMEIGELSRKISRGKNTTRHSELFFVRRDTFVCDTPGFSSIYVDGIGEKELKDYFPEFSAFEDECRFLGCVHIGERECGVKNAAARGELAKSRYENYRLIYDELKNRRRY